jgi:hypothetical protein
MSCAPNMFSRSHCAALLTELTRYTGKLIGLDGRFGPDYVRWARWVFSADNVLRAHDVLTTLESDALYEMSHRK